PSTVSRYADTTRVSRWKSPCRPPSMEPSGRVQRTVQPENVVVDRCPRIALRDEAAISAADAAPQRERGEQEGDRRGPLADRMELEHARIDAVRLRVGAEL